MTTTNLQQEGGPLHIAFLGCGNVAHQHARTLAGMRLPVRCSFASRDPLRASELAARFPGSEAFESYEAALTSRAVDAVCVVVPPSLHREWTLAALSEGKHVIVEKPGFLRPEDFDEVGSLAAGAGLQVLVAENYFYKPVLRVLRRLITGGVIGEPLLVHLNAVKWQNADGWRSVPQLAGGGALFEGGVHWMSFAAHLGLTLEQVGGLQPRGTCAPERSMLVTLRYAEGAVGTLAYSWEVPSPLRGLRMSRIFGKGGSIAFESNGLFVLAHGARTCFRVPGLRDIGGYRAMLADFVRALRDGEPAALTLHEARRDVERVAAVYRAARAGDSRADLPEAAGEEARWAL